MNHTKHFQNPFRIALLALISVTACTHQQESAEQQVVPKTLVAVASASYGPISENITLNATSSYLRKHMVKSFIAGYVKTVKAVIGEPVKNGQVLFSLVTKEAAVYNSLKIKDTSFAKPEDILVKAPNDGVLSTVDHQAGEYVQEGDQLATISEPQSMVFILDIPYELHAYAKQNSKCIITLPDGKELSGTMSSVLPQVDAQAQTQRVLVKPDTEYPIPENLVATISLLKSAKEKALIVPKTALLSNEKQTEFWVMKLINDSTAVKVPVKTGLKSTDKVEILEPEFTENDKVLTYGNYGLSDTAKVRISKTDSIR